MGKLILVSVVFASVLVPTLAARDASAKRGFKRAVLYAVLFNVVYLLALRFVVPRI